MSTITLENTLANIPEIARGYGYIINADSKKGDRILYANKKSVVIRDLTDMTKSRIFAGEHMGNATVAVSSPNGEYIASGDDHGRMLVWGQSNYMIKSDIPMCQGIQDIAWDADGKRIVAGGKGTESLARAVAWDTGSALGSVSGNLKTVLSVDYSKVRPYRILTAGEDMKIGYFEGPPFKFKEWKKEHSNYVNKVRFSPKGDTFASVSSDKTIKIYDSKTSDLIKSIEGKTDGHTGSIYSFAWSPDSTKILTCGADKMSKIWNVESGEVETTFTFGKDVGDMQMCALWHNDYIMTVSLNGAMNFLDPATPDTPKKRVLGHAGEVTDITVHHETKRMYSSDVNGIVCSWTDGEASWFTGKGHGKAIRAIALNKDGTKLATVGLDNKLRVSDCKSMELSDDAVDVGGAPACVTCGTKSDVVVVGTSNDTLVIVSGLNSSKFALPGKPISIAFNPDETKIAVGFDKNGAKVYDWNGGSPTLATEHKTFKRTTRKVTWSPCGEFLLMCGDDRQALVFQGEKQRNPTDWEFHSATVMDAAWSPSGKSVLTVGADLAIIHWKDTEKFGTTRSTNKMSHREGIVKVEFIDENTAVTVGLDRCLKIWKLD